MSDQTPPSLPRMTAHAPVERRHRLLVLEAYGYQEQWLIDRTSHCASKWLDHGHRFDAVSGNADAMTRIAQLLADYERDGRQDREAYRQGLQRVLDRVERALADELGQPQSLPPPAIIYAVPDDLARALEQLAEALNNSVTDAGLVARVIEVFARHRSEASTDPEE